MQFKMTPTVLRMPLESANFVCNSLYTVGAECNCLRCPYWIARGVRMVASRARLQSVFYVYRFPAATTMSQLVGHALPTVSNPLAMNFRETNVDARRLQCGHWRARPARKTLSAAAAKHNGLASHLSNEVMQPCRERPNRLIMLLRVRRR